MQKQFKHGSMRTWELTVNAVRILGGKAKSSEVLDYIQRTTDNYNKKNLHTDLDLVSVNCKSRTNHTRNKSSRRSDSGHELDALYKSDSGKSATYYLYSKQDHGVWEIYSTPKQSKSGFSVRSVSDIFSALHEAEESMGHKGAFDPTDLIDARQRLVAAVVSRRGQQAFRQSLFAAYENKCAISGTNVPAVLEAAHIYPYRGPETNHASNGILLRADLHTLFDLGLLKINPQTFQVELATEIEVSEYSPFNGLTISLPKSESHRPNPEALRLKYNINESPV
jgi:hypothetical protein